MTYDQFTGSRPSVLAWFSIGGLLLMAILLFLPLGGHGDDHADHDAAHATAGSSASAEGHGGADADAGSGEDHHRSTEVPPLWFLGVLPFVGILGCIAFLPLIPATHHWWEDNVHRLAVAVLFALATLAYYLAVRGPGALRPVLEHALLAEYIPFIVLLFALYVISGGISLQGDLPAHPATNVAFLGIGAALASFIGTTGASMLLIRPLLQTNRERKRVAHTVVFFIFLVSNVGGTLLPVGDPPLFLGYLKGVPFFWTFGLWLPWLVTSLALLAIYFVWDSFEYRRETLRDLIRDETQKVPLRLEGSINFLWLAGVVLSVAFVVPGKPMPGLGFVVPEFLRELVMLGFVGLSLWTTPPGVRERNRFDYVAIGEVAALFVGIFVAMQVPVEVLNVKGASLGLTEPWHFFWATGTLSSVLDNAPTYVVFFETANALTHEPSATTLTLVGGGLIEQGLLVGISLGAVFMGAMTYIGNGPNFMVKAIAEQSGVRMPSFPGYVLRYSAPILVPVFAVVTWIFL